jgi:O-antigen/teichoic acid export membrane protein
VLLPLCPLLVLTTNAISQRVVARELAGIGAGVAAGAAVLVATGAAAVAAGLGPLWLAAAYVVGKLVEAAVIVSGRVWVVRARTGNALATAVLLWPFSLQMILGVIYPRLAIFTVERMTTRAELGVFSVAVALQSALLLVPTSLALLQFPELTRRAMAADLPAVRRILVRYTIASALGVGAGLIVLAVFIAPIARALRVPAQHEWLLLAYSALALLTIFSAMMPFLLQARGLESTAARLSILTLMLGLSLQVAALSRFGLPGILLGAGLSDVSATALFAWAAVRGWSQAKDPAR